MDSALKILYLLALVFLVEFFLYNFIMPEKLPRIPGDLDIQRGIRVYIPFVSALVISVILTIFFFGYFQ